MYSYIKIGKKKLKEFKRKAAKKIEEKEIKTYLAFIRIRYRRYKSKEELQEIGMQNEEEEEYKGDIRQYIFINDYEKAEAFKEELQKFIPKFFSDNIEDVAKTLEAIEGEELDLENVKKSFYAVVGFDVFDLKRYKYNEDEYNIYTDYDVENEQLEELLKELGYTLESEFSKYLRHVGLKRNLKLQKNLLRNEIRLDYDFTDEDLLMDTLKENIKEIKKGMKYIRVRRTKKGYHVYVGKKREIRGLKIYRIQKKLGSDEIREELNEYLEEKTGFYQNILFKLKHKIAYATKKDKYLIVYTSKEAPAPFVVKKIKKVLGVNYEK